MTLAEDESRSSQMEEEAQQERPDPRAIMQRIREQVGRDASRLSDRPLAKKALEPEQAKKVPAGLLVHSEDLRFLNANYVPRLELNLEQVQSHRPGPVGKLLVSFKRKVLSTVWEFLFKDFLAQQKEYQTHLVRYLNEISRYVDERDAGNFWELIHKLDFDIARAMERVERVNSDLQADLHSSEKRQAEALGSQIRKLQEIVASVKGESERHSVELQQLQAVSSGFESILSTATSKSSEAFEAKETSLGEMPDQRYLLLENRFRGSREEIESRLSIYPPIFAGSAQPVLEIGPGRGELQQLFQRESIPAVGAELDEAMVEECRRQGFEVAHSDGNSFLKSRAENSLAGLIALQVVEHLRPADLEEMIALARSRIVSGGKLVFETIDPRSLTALSSNYFRDPTHVAPLHPETLKYLLERSGFGNCEIRGLSPVPEEAQLRPLELEAWMTPSWSHMIGQLNSNIEQLNGLLYGYQDYCIIAEVP